MKKIILFALMSAFVLGCGLMLTNCGGGSGSVSKGKKNEYLGKLPSIYANYYAEKEAYEEKAKEEIMKLAEGGEKNFGKLMKLNDEQEKKLDEMRDKFKADVSAETKAILGREIPISYSENLKNSNQLFYTVATPLKLIENDEGHLSLTFIITAKNDFEVPTYKGAGNEYSVFMRYITSDGSTVWVTSIPTTSLNTKPLQFKAGDLLKEITRGFGIDSNSDPASWANFAGIEFCTSEELMTAAKEYR